MSRTLLSLVLLIPILVFGQQTLDGLDTSRSSHESDNLEEEVSQVVDQMPEFPGGHEAMFRFIQENLEYPEFAREMGIEGRVLTEFTIDSLGAIRDIIILRSIGAGCEDETVRVLELMPLWHPGIHRGRPVNVKFHLPLSFRLPEDVIKDDN